MKTLKAHRAKAVKSAKKTYNNTRVAEGRNVRNARTAMHNAHANVQFAKGTVIGNMRGTVSKVRAVNESTRWSWSTGNTSFTIGSLLVVCSVIAILALWGFGKISMPWES